MAVADRSHAEADTICGDGPGKHGKLALGPTRHGQNGCPFATGEFASKARSRRLTGACSVQHRFKCSKCNQIFLVAERAFGQTLDCPTCKVSLRIDTFSSQHGSAVMACQITAGGVGINLQSASAVILLEPQHKPTTEWQAIKRVHRMGQSRKVLVHRILARDTVDESLKELLGRKTSLFNEYARESAIKNASAAATDTSEAALAQRLVEMEVRRRDAALAS